MPTTLEAPAPGARPVVLPIVSEPAVTVVIVTYGGYDLAIRAIACVADHTEAAVEVLVVDNASPDGTGLRLERSVENARFVLNAGNLGFGIANNQGALLARGEHLVLLNSDCFVRPGWLPPLLRALRRPGVGAAVPKFLHEDGRLQEAGAVISREGSTLAYGDGDDPNRWEYRFRRTIDYGSAACLAIPRWVYQRLGGFDPAYGRGYFEDVDLLLRMQRDLGLRTIYEPASVVVHRRGGSFTTAEGHALYRRNRGLVRARFGGLLAGRPAFAGGISDGALVAARDAPTRQRLLVVDDRVPHWDRGSGDPRMAEMIEAAADMLPEARITLLAADPHEGERYATRFLRAGIEVAAPPSAAAWLHGRSGHYDAVLVSRPNNHAALDAILRATQPAARRGYDAEALYHRRLAREAELATGPERDMLLRRARAAMRLESAAVRAAHAISCVSDDEAAWIRSVAGDRPVHVVGMVGRLPAVVPGYGGRRDIIFYGGFMAGPSGPNSDAVRFAVEEIMPRIWDALPDVRLRVIGADPTPEVLALAGPRVDVVGFVSDPAEHLMAARLHLAPIRFGAGVKLRLVESMAAGLPMVTTPNGAEGLGLGPERSRLVGETPSELATMAIDLLTNEPAWDAAQVAVRDVVRRRFGPAPFRNELRALLADLTLTQNATRPGGSWPS